MALVENITYRNQLIGLIAKRTDGVWEGSVFHIIDGFQSNSLDEKQDAAAWVIKKWKNQSEELRVIRYKKNKIK